MQHLQYNPSQCIECGECLLCPTQAISSVQPLKINANCIECEQCINACPKGEKVLRISHNDELGDGWISPFGYQPSTNPSEPKKDDNTSENPSKPSEAESSTGTKDNGQDSSDSSQESSSAESKSDSTYTPAQKAQLEIIKTALLSAPPPHKIQASTKVINAIESLKRYLSTMS